MAKLIFILIIGIIILNYLLNRVLEYLNISRCSTTLPSELEGIYSSEKYSKSQKYLIVNYRFALLTDTFDIAIILLMFFYQGFDYVNNIALGFTQNYILSALLFFGILMFASDIIGIPFDIYDTFVIEKRFGFNKTTANTFIGDKLKTYLLAAILGGGILALIIWFYHLTSNLFWLYAWILVSIFMYLWPCSIPLL